MEWNGSRAYYLVFLWAVVAFWHSFYKYFVDYSKSIVYRNPALIRPTNVDER